MLDKPSDEFTRQRSESYQLQLLRREAPIMGAVTLSTFVVSLWIHVPSLLFVLMGIAVGGTAYASWAVEKVRRRIPWLFPSVLLGAAPVVVMATSTSPKLMILLQGFSLFYCSMSAGFVTERWFREKL